MYAKYLLTKSSCFHSIIISPCRYINSIQLPQSRALTSKLLGPSVRKLLDEYNLKQVDVPSSGPYQILLKGDVLTYISNNKLQAKPMMTEKRQDKVLKLKETDFHVDIPLTDSQRNIAQQLINTKKMIPHAYMGTDCQIDNFFKYQEILSKDGDHVSVNDFIVKCAATALQKIPNMNVVNFNGKIQRLRAVNITLVDSKGAVVINKAESLTIKQISIQSQQPSLLNNDSTNCSLRISNLGEFGVLEFCEVLTPPEVAILAVGADRLVVEDGSAKKKVKVTLSFDNTAVTETDAGQFLTTFRQCLENPFQILCIT